MSTYTPVSKVIGTTGATTGSGLATLITAQNSAVATAVTAALAVTGVAPQSIAISPTESIQDAGLYALIQTVTYTVIS